MSHSSTSIYGTLLYFSVAPDALRRECQALVRRQDRAPVPRPLSGWGTESSLFGMVAMASGTGHRGDADVPNTGEEAAVPWEGGPRHSGKDAALPLARGTGLRLHLG